jgi:hypothetical protein
MDPKDQDDSIVLEPTHTDKIASEGDETNLVMFDKTAYDEPGENPLDRVDSDLHSK